MEIIKEVKNKLLSRGFTKEQLLNNRGLIGATIDLTIDTEIIRERVFIICCYEQGEITIGNETIKFAEGDLIRTNENDLFRWIEESHHNNIKVAIYEAKVVCDLS